MKAAYFEKYGLPEQVLYLKEIETPKPKENEVRVKIHATAINDYDWGMVRGKPYMLRLMYGLFGPKRNIPGMELSGTVEGVGAGVDAFQVGDAVFGDTSEYGFGTFAEYICINEKALTKKPEGLSFEEAAAIPHAATLAFQGLKDLGEISQGQKILINGGGGGVGTIGLQLAKLYGCEVTGVDTKEKQAMMREFGFDHTLDYKDADFTKTGEKYDLILDCKSSKHPLTLLRVLKKEGKYITIGGHLSTLFKILIWGQLISMFSSKRLRVLGLHMNKDLAEIGTLFEQGKIKCQIDGPYQLEDTPRLVQYFGEGKHKGKIIIQLLQ